MPHSRCVQGLLAEAGLSAALDPSRGFDHGAWVPMRHLYPQADVPMVPLAMPADLDARGAAALGAALRPLRDEGVLVIGSGSLTHNLHELDMAAGETPTPEARGFFERVSDALASRITPEAFADHLMATPGLARVHPTLEHLLPLPFARAAAGEEAAVQRLDGGYRYGALSMHAFVFG
jgi:4,5-DOPA dioxygenase extradiol